MPARRVVHWPAGVSESGRRSARAPRPAAVLLRDDRGPNRPDDDDRLVQHVGAGRAVVVPGGDDLAGLQLHGATRGAHPGDGPGDLEEVPGVDRRQELDLVVADEQALVAVGDDGDLGDDVAEELEHARALDEVAPVVRLLLADAHAQRADDGLGLLGHVSLLQWWVSSVLQISGRWSAPRRRRLPGSC